MCPTVVEKTNWEPEEKAQAGPGIAHSGVCPGGSQDICVQMNKILPKDARPGKQQSLTCQKQTGAPEKSNLPFLSSYTSSGHKQSPRIRVVHNSQCLYVLSRGKKRKAATCLKQGGKPCSGNYRHSQRQHVAGHVPPESRTDPAPSLPSWSPDPFLV